MKIEELVNDLIGTVLKYHFNELPKTLAEKILDELEVRFGIRSFAKVRRIARLGYVFRNYHKSDEILAGELLVCTRVIKELRHKMGLKMSHGGDRRSKKFKERK